MCSSVFKKRRTEKERKKNKSQSLLWHWNTPLRSQVHSVVFFRHWMHKYNKALRSGLGCGSALWRNEGDWRCMCPGIGTGRDPSSPNYPHSRRPGGTFSLNTYMHPFSHPWAQCAHNPLHVTSSCAWYQWAILCALASSGRTNLAENRSIFNNYDDGEASGTVTKLLTKV